MERRRAFSFRSCLGSPQRSSQSPTCRTPTARRGLTLVELLVVIGIIIVLLGMFLPMCRRTGGASRRITCANNLRQIGLAMHNYESAHLELPMAIGIRNETGQLQPKRFSGFVAMLPLMEQISLYDQIVNPSEFKNVKYPAYGPPFSDQSYPPWTESVPGFECPADYASGPFGCTNYAFSIGDTARQIYQPNKLRGPFGAFKNASFGDITDGTSNTIAFAEMGGPQIDLISGGFITEGKPEWLDSPGAVFSQVNKGKGKYKSSKGLGGRGSHWADGSAGIGLINTILPPGSPSFTVSENLNGDGIYSAGSTHPGGVNVVLADDSTHFISNNIDSGNPNNATLTVQQIESEDVVASPHGVWGAMGSMAGDEASDEF